MATFQPFPVFGGRHRHGGDRGQHLVEAAWRMGRHVQHDQECRVQVRPQRSEQLTQGLDAASGGPHDHDPSRLTHAFPLCMNKLTPRAVAQGFRVPGPIFGKGVSRYLPGDESATPPTFCAARWAAPAVAFAPRSKPCAVAFAP